MRPAFLFKRESASEQRRIFGGKYLPGPLARPELLPFLPDVPGLRVQALHTDDAANAYRLAVRDEDARGPYNLAAEPPVDAELLGELMGARPVRLPRSAARSAIAAAWGLHLLPASPHLFDAVLRLPLMDCTRARAELGWRPVHTAAEVLEEFLRGFREAREPPRSHCADARWADRAREARRRSAASPWRSPDGRRPQRPTGPAGDRTAGHGGPPRVSREPIRRRSGVRKARVCAGVPGRPQPEDSSGTGCSGWTAPECGCP